MFQRLAESFSIGESFVEQSLRTEESATLLKAFLLKPSSPPRLFAFYQPRQVRGDTEGEWNVPKVPGEKVLFLTLGGGGTESLQGKAAYFLRLQKDGKPVSLDVAGCSQSVVFGELGSSSNKSMLHDLETVLETLYRPIIHSLSTTAPKEEQKSLWGSASTEQRDEFLNDMDKFSVSLGETIKSMVGGVDLRKPDPRIEQMAMALQLNGVDSKKSTGDTSDPSSQGSTGTTEVVSHYHDLLAEWCGTIEQYLAESQKKENGGRGDDDDESQSGSNHDRNDGPWTELEYWRRRMQRLTNIMEQLKTKECKQVLGVLASYTKGGGDQGSVQGHAVYALLRRWKAIDVSITEAANEAKDNEKYLKTLEKFIEPLYEDDPMAIIDTLPALMNSIKMIHTIARYYNTTERMTNLFVKITNQMINNCCAHIVSAASRSNPNNGQAQKNGEFGDESSLMTKEEAALMGASSSRRGGSTGDKKTQHTSVSMSTAAAMSTATSGASSIVLWETDAANLIDALEACLKLNEAYQEQYRLTKDKLLTMPKSKQFDFREQIIFGKFDLFCRRAVKLIDMFSTIRQFESLASHKLEGMENLISDFRRIIQDFRTKRHPLLAYQNNKFDRDYVEFNVKISDLESALQQFINQSFENITSISNSLNLLRKFQQILQRDNLKSDLDDKFNIIFQNYGLELEQVQHLYEKHKHNPPFPRNLPPVSGNITWSRHLLKRIEDPMKKFESNQNVLSTKDAKKIIKTYNKVARTLVAFEYLWYRAWVDSVETAKAGLQATLVIRHPEDGRLYVNFDHEILQLIREAKCLDRMGIEVPEGARIVLLQEDKFKAYYNDLHYALNEYERVAQLVIPVTNALLRPHMNDMEYKLRPGMITLTWTSMNIDAYKHHVHTGLQRLEELVININDLIENRIEKNLKTVSKSLLVSLPADEAFTLEDFVAMQEVYIARKAELLQGKNVQVENAVYDLIGLIKSYPLDPHISPVRQEDADRLISHYNHFMYQALLNCTKNSLNAIKKRMAKRGGNAFIYVERPFFEVDVQLNIPKVQLSPSLDDVQRSINKAALAVLRCTQQLYDWGQGAAGPNATEVALPASPVSDVPEEDQIYTEPEDIRITFFQKIARDIEIVRVVLLLTGSIQGLRNLVSDYLETFSDYSWLWTESKDKAYAKFMKTRPELSDYNRELQNFSTVETQVENLGSVHNIGALSLLTKNVKIQLKHMAELWKVSFSTKLHEEARACMNEILDYIRTTDNWLKRTQPVDLLTLRSIMDKLKEIRVRESGIEAEITPVLDMYSMLERFLPQGYMDKDEMDQISVLRSSWRKLVNHAEDVADNLMNVQVGFKKSLLGSIRDFVVNVREFRADWIAKGPGVPGTPPNIAVERLRAFKSEYELRDRKYQLYHSGEELFALAHTEYPELHKTKSEIDLMDTLYGLYVEVHEYLDIEWPHLPWEDVFGEMPAIRERMDQFMIRLARMPKSLRQWDAFKTLKKKLEDFQITIPLLEQLSKDSIKPRHWTELMRTTGHEFRIDGGDFRLQTLLDCHLEEVADDVVELCDGAEKQQQISVRILDIRERWAAANFDFNDWKERKIPVLRACGPIIEELEESQLQCQTMLTMRHVTPFKQEVAALLTRLSDTADTLERWLKVQMLWCSLESVFTGGDIAKQMPVEAKKFVKIDKDWAKVMARAADASLVVECCENELLKNNLPVMYSELEMCQKALDGYLEQKRSMFPRFYFVSNPVLLQMLSQGSDPKMIQPFYQTVFDAIDHVVHDSKNARNITAMVSLFKGTTEKIEFLQPVVAKGNIEEWLAKVLTAQRVAMKDVCRSCADEAYDNLMEDETTGTLRPFVDSMPPQYALLGIQLLWTATAEEAFAALKASRANKNAISDCLKRNTDILKELSSWCLEELPSKLTRTKYEVLITIQVHQRDVIADLVQMHKAKRLGVAGPEGEGDTDFEWNKQARFYWKGEEEDSVDDDGAMCVQCTDVEFKYMYEYLGCKGRLVITPLTDRCYVSLSQAMGMCYGGAPAGPAGTGKTETVKDMGRTLGIYVIVTNCTDQATYQSMAKIDKGLCMSGLWGCFDEFNRIKLPVLSVVAQQILAILEAKRTGATKLTFPGDAVGSQVNFDDACGFFITMNPGYAGRQELPENLKALFRGVTMMVPDRMIIIRVMLCAQGYNDFTVLSRKFTVLYKLCEEQLSKQRHYDFGLRNILSVLRTAGQTKRENVDADEAKLLYQTLRDMNLSKLVASDVPLFLSLLGDLFPSIQAPKPKRYGAVEDAIKEVVTASGLIHHPTWVKKVVQLYETINVRHGIMVIGPTGGGKTQCMNVLHKALAKVTGVAHRLAKMNPKAILASQMYGEVDQLSDEWTTGVFAAMWTKYNQRSNAFNTWIVCDGPVDAIWIEDLNTVLDDNRILTLANGDRIPMTDNVKIMFENETLINASPATVSRCGIIYVSASELGWTPLVNAWTAATKGNKDGSSNPLLNEKQTIMSCFFKYMGDDETPADPGKLLSYLRRETTPVMPITPAGAVAACQRLIDGMLNDYHRSSGNKDQTLTPRVLERIFLYALTWTVGGVLEGDDRRKFDEYLRTQETTAEVAGDDDDDEGVMPETATDSVASTIYDYFVDVTSGDWVKFSAPVWDYPIPEDDEDTVTTTAKPTLRFSSLLVPTQDSERALNLIGLLQSPQSQKGKQPYPVLLTGQSGTAKTSTTLMWSQTRLDQKHSGFKFVNFSSATTAQNFQISVEESLDKRGGKNFGPANGKSLTVFVDDISLPEINEWGDQPTNEIVRQLVESNCFAFLDKDKRGDMKICEDLVFLAAMTHPGGGRSDIPSRLKRHFMVLNMTPPSIESINDIYGQILRGRFRSHPAGKGEGSVVSKLTSSTIDLWKLTRSKLKSTPAKFHYNFTMRDLSRIFQGVVRISDDATVIDTGDARRTMLKAGVVLIRVLRHECERVFCDKLTNITDKDWYLEAFQRVAVEHFGPELANAAGDPENYFVDFLQEDNMDEDGVLISKAPQVYEVGGTLATIKSRCLAYMEQHNVVNPTAKLGLVLFDDALRHLMRISRIIQMPRGSALLVGVGGSGKRSLTRLATFMSGHREFQIRMTKSYNLSNFGDDLKECFFHAGGAQNQIVLVLADTQIKYETFLEYLNSLLLTGDVPGLFSKEELALAMAEVQDSFEKEMALLGKSGTPEDLKRYLVDKVRDRLHIVLCMSPAHPEFSTRARRFPGIFSACSIDWFLSWPRDALVSVATALIGDQMESIECTPVEKQALLEHMGEVHTLAVDMCDEYRRKTRRMRVSQTPKSYLSFLGDYRAMYTRKLGEVKQKASNVTLGLEKLEKAAEDVASMSIVLEVEREKLKKATEDTNAMLGSLEISSLEAKNESDMVRGIKEACESDAARIGKEKELCLEDLAKAQPYVDDANTAIDSIKSADISEIKKLAKPSDIIRLVFDCVILLFHNPLSPVEPQTLSIKKQEISFIKPSWQHALPMMADTQFLRHLQWFGKGSEARPTAGKDLMNPETIEFLEIYMNLEHFNAKVAKNASNAAEGLCRFVTAMKFYFEASKLIKPKLEALTVAEAQLKEAEGNLAGAMKRLDACNEHLAGLKAQFEAQMAEKTRVEEGARSLERRMDMASQLIEGLAGERVRWNEDSKTFDETTRRLVGDCALACAFVSYAGAFNQEYRLEMINNRFRSDLEQREIPVSPGAVDLVGFLADNGIVGEWNIQGLPTDMLSTQNGILVTRSANGGSRYPLLVDPQAQAIGWIRKLEEDRLPDWKETHITSPRLKDHVEFCMGEGRAMIIVGIEVDNVDPMLDPVLLKEIVKKGRSLQITVADQAMDYDPNFSLYLVCRVPDPDFSPEMQAMTTVVDFAVTARGLEDQLLGTVIHVEQRALQDQLNDVLTECNQNTKTLLQLDALLLERLSSGSGNLLDDAELIGVLRNTQKKAADVKKALHTAVETRESINEKREQFRPVAARGSILYFAIIDVSKINVMYQTSLKQFLELFLKAMEIAEPARLATKRVTNIMEVLTYKVYRYINRGLYEEHKLLFVFILATRILVKDEVISQGDVDLFLRGGAALSMDSPGVRKKPFTWLSDEAWLNVSELSNKHSFFRTMQEDLMRNENQWWPWYEHNTPEKAQIPDYEVRLTEDDDLGPWYRLMLVRTFRNDRTQLAIKEFVRAMGQLGPKYVEPVTDKLEEIYDEMVNSVPVIFLLSMGADPTDSIMHLCRKRKCELVATISMGEGQEKPAMAALNQAAQSGGWVLLQNCELGLGLMDKMEDLLIKLRDGDVDRFDPSFRLFITACPHSDFPLGLLQMSTKVTNEPPAGLRAGLMRSYSTIIDQDRLERIDGALWKRLLFGMCFLHSIVQERRKFGPLGWSIPYEFNTGDITACLTFLEKHLFSGHGISWTTVQYMVSEIQYGGKITDDLDRRLFNVYASKWVSSDIEKDSFMFNPQTMIGQIEKNFVYKVPLQYDHAAYARYCASFPEVDSPEISGLHPNADLTFRVKESQKMMKTLLANTSSTDSGSTAKSTSDENDVEEPASQDEVVHGMAGVMLTQVPESYNPDKTDMKIKVLGGMEQPLNIFLYQEIQVLQFVIDQIGGDLKNVQQAIDGEIVMTDELASTTTDIFNAKVPRLWMYHATGNEQAWINSTMGLWMANFSDRDTQIRHWLNTDRPPHFSFKGFFNPQGFLTAMKQEVTRKHRSDGWALDDVIYHTEVTEYEKIESVSKGPREGIYASGLFIDGAAWSKPLGSLVESEPKKLFAALPVLYVTGTTKQLRRDHIKSGAYGPNGPYECPLYKYPVRTDRFYIGMVSLASRAQPAGASGVGSPARDAPKKEHWILRGVALTCSTDFE
tara:strand:- start:150 stop:14669 length:14520 start_codon:yes stop_codon:yes gene_type:complete